MNRRRWTPVFAGACLLGVRAPRACDSSATSDGLVDAGDAQVGVAPRPESRGYVLPGAPCSSAVGAVPAPNCVSGPGATTGPGPTSSHEPAVLLCPQTSPPPCVVGKTATGGSCGDPTTCLPLTTNKAPIYNFRMQALHITAPPALATAFVQDDIITPSVTLNAAPPGSSVVSVCGYSNATGVGGLNWLLSVNKATRTIVTGGAPPVLDPYDQGYCFVDATFTQDGGVTRVAPLEAGVTFDPGGSFSTRPAPGVLNIPIFLSAEDAGSPIILPLSGAQLSQVTISPDGNCIGDINPEWYGFTMAAGCADINNATCPKWVTDGSLSGYIMVDAYGNNGLCPIGSAPNCPPPKGDYCSTTHSPGGCEDSMWFSATFAAHAINISPTGSSLCAGK